ncbi:MAG TPA: TlpA disulfide reductase family protein [Pyrinomonadaceae bacterium]|jgi:thiol-disulfide isomerase/thioredoxin|nr:TlpA disulfide reductase family protein [Pyrinomonadaceae bacterium]
MNSSEQPLARTKIFWTPLRIALTLTVFALLATFGVSSCNSTSNAPAANANEPKVNVTVNSGEKNIAPVTLPASALDAPLKTMDGKPFKLSDLNGKVLVIDLWATWCGPCRSEVPELVQMQTEYGPRGFEVIGLDIDPDSDTAEKVSDFSKEFKINYKVAFAEADLARSLMRGGNIPQSLVVGRDGHVVVHFTGFSAVSTPKKMRAAIEQALQ